MIDLLQYLLGHDGATALSKLLKTNLSPYILPRVIIGWARSVKNGQTITPESGPITKLSKGEEGYSGSANIKGFQYEFEDVPEQRVAAIVSVAFEDAVSCVQTKDADLAKLSKTIDRLIAVNLLKKISVSPTELQQDAPSPTVRKLDVTKTRVTHVPRIIKISKSKSFRKCKTCGKIMFQDEKFVGCLCYGPLSKSIKTRKTPNGYLLVVKTNDSDILYSLVKDFDL